MTICFVSIERESDLVWQLVKIFCVIDKEFANVFTTALCLEGLYGKYFLNLFVARDKACTELCLCLFMFGVHC